MSILKLVTSIIIITSSLSASARRGENDTPTRPEDGRTIQCLNAIDQSVVLQFSSQSGQGQAQFDQFDLNVKTKIDDISEMTIVDKRSSDSVRVKRLEELLKATITSNNTTTPAVIESNTHRGYAELNFRHPESQDEVRVQSLSRRGQSRLEVLFTTSENRLKPIHIICSKIR